MSNIINITKNEEYSSLLERGKEQNKKSIIFFSASWHEPCKQMKIVFTELASEYPEMDFLLIDAENVPEVSEKYPIKSVPTFVALMGSKIADVLEGASAPKLVEMIKKHSKLIAKQKSISQNDGVKRGESDLNARLAKLVKAAPVMLFMKGSPDSPRCGFSKTMIGILKECDVKFGYFDILTDQNVRAGLKIYSDWSTYPQLYVNGQLIGGLDVVKELKEEGELKSVFPKEPTKDEINNRLTELINSNKVMLFMKGSPNNPQCGFSRKIVSVMQEAGVSEFGHFDILTDNDVRQGLKAYSNWPTYPQLYVKGELIGGLDVILEMVENGEFKDIL